jgi:hypothetical protein
VEKSGIRAYLGLHEAGGRGSDFFPKSAFTYDAEKNLYLCPAVETLRALGDAEDRRSRGKVVTYRARGSVCAVCSLKPQCTTNKNGRSLRRGPGDKYIDLLRVYMQTKLYQKAIRKRKVWIEPLFAEGKLWHGMRRFWMRTHPPYATTFQDPKLNLREHNSRKAMLRYRLVSGMRGKPTSSILGRVAISMRRRSVALVRASSRPTGDLQSSSPKPGGSDEPPPYPSHTLLQRTLPKRHAESPLG